MTDLHFQEEQDFGRDFGLWDSGEGVCCAYFQTGACAHTESFHEDDLEDLPAVAPVSEPVLLNDEPF